MLIFPEINPIAFQMGPLSVHWYGLMYLFAFGATYGLLALRLKYSKFPARFTMDQLSDILFYAAVGTIIGGRLGYVLFYTFPDFLNNPWFLFQIWKGGMSFHGGLMGVIGALSIYAHKIKKSLFDITDLIAPAVPMGLAFGRLGNFINGELWGRVTDVPWGMVFPNAGFCRDILRNYMNYFWKVLSCLFSYGLFRASPDRVLRYRVCFYCAMVYSVLWLSFSRTRQSNWVHCIWLVDEGTIVIVTDVFIGNLHHDFCLPRIKKPCNNI